MTEPVVDVMLPHYGRLDLVQETVRSVLAQDDEHWRLTIVDDSGDLPDVGLEAWCAGLAEPRLRYRRNRHNLGINRNFQRCVTLVEHELAVLVGSDDRCCPTTSAPCAGRTARTRAGDHPAGCAGGRRAR